MLKIREITKAEEENFYTIPVGTSVWWHYRSAIGHGTIKGIYKKGTNSDNTIYNVEEHDHHEGEKSILHHAGSALHVGGKKIEKAIGGKGEGSRGGKIIGHTGSGKPIYKKDNYVNFSDIKDFVRKNHKDFSQVDHLLAARIHEDKQHLVDKRMREIEKNKSYDKLTDLEKKKIEELNKDSHLHYFHKEAHKDFAEYRKNDKKNNMEKAESNSEELSKHPKFKKVMDEWKAGTLKSSNGEKVTDQKQAEAIAFSEVKSHLEKGTSLEKAFSTIGTTNSGKDVYKNYNEKAYSNFTPEDHEEAATLHRNLAGKQDRTTDAGIRAYKTHMSQAKTHSMHSRSMNIYKKQEMNIEKAFSSLGLEFEEEVYFEKAEFDTESRKKLAKKGEALPDGSFPIRNKRDLKNAIHDVGRANDPEKAKRWIKKRAKDLDAEEILPEDWKEGNEDKKIEKAFSFLGLDFYKAETEEVDEEELTEPAEMSDAELIECISEGKGDRVRQAKKELEYRLKIKKQSENF